MEEAATRGAQGSGARRDAHPHCTDSESQVTEPAPSPKESEKEGAAPGTASSSRDCNEIGDARQRCR
jgi:hypothetical protein